MSNSTAERGMTLGRGIHTPAAHFINTVASARCKKAPGELQPFQRFSWRRRRRHSYQPRATPWVYRPEIILSAESAIHCRAELSPVAGPRRDLGASDPMNRMTQAVGLPGNKAARKPRALPWAGTSQAFGLRSTIRVAKKQVSHASSRVAVKLCLRGRREGVWVSPIGCICIVEQRAQGRPGAGVVNEPFPSGVAIQFGQQLRQVCHQFLPLRGGQGSNCSLDLLHGAHGSNLLPPPLRSKRAVATQGIQRRKSAFVPVLPASRPGGTSENSPAFQRRDQAAEESRPDGTAEAQGPIRPSLRDLSLVTSKPGVETPGYSRDVPPGQSLNAGLREQSPQSWPHTDGNGRTTAYY